MNKEMERRVTELEEKLRRLEAPRAKRPSVVNIKMVSADTEYPHKLPIGCKRFQMQCRDATDIRFATEQGKIATPDPPYYTVKSGTVFRSGGNLDIQGDMWLYLACDSTNKYVEILQWT